jgi:hypothetical protein
MRLTEWRESK